MISAWCGKLAVACDGAGKSHAQSGLRSIDKFGFKAVENWFHKELYGWASPI